MNTSTTLVLASASPRRRELMALLGLPLTVLKPDIDETQQPGEAPVDYVQRLSREKAQAIAAQGEQGLLVAADTIVVAPGGEVLGKPRDADDARRMLRQLRGQSHKVLTGMTVLYGATGKAITDVCESQVTIRPMTDDEITAYIASGDPMDKAAAYAIQNVEFAPVEQVVGCPANVMGLPMCHVVRALRRLGVELPDSAPLACRMTYGGYYCAITDIAMPGLTERGIIP